MYYVFSQSEFDYLKIDLTACSTTPFSIHYQCFWFQPRTTDCVSTSTQIIHSFMHPVQILMCLVIRALFLNWSYCICLRFFSFMYLYFQFKIISFNCCSVHFSQMSHSLVFPVLFLHVLMRKFLVMIMKNRIWIHLYFGVRKYSKCVKSFSIYVCTFFGCGEGCLFLIQMSMCLCYALMFALL